MYANNFATIGIKYLADLQLNELCQLRDELDIQWKNGQSVVSDKLYDKVIDSIDYELPQLKTNTYEYGVKRTDQQLKNLLDYLTQLHSQGKSIVENIVWDILNRELNIRQALIKNTTLSYPSNWTTMSLNENPIQFISLDHSSEEYQNISNFFLKSLEKSSSVIYSIIRIQNLRLWYIFQELQKLIPHNTQRLFHGTASHTHQKLIMYHGFCSSFCPGGAIGDGVYFAVHAHYSDQNPYVLKKTNHRRELFICQAIIGNSGQGYYGAKSPPSGCHSLHASASNSNTMFCIFNNFQVYPEYIVQYDYV